MGWNDHHPAIEPDDPDPGETLRGMADEIRDPECHVCGEYLARFGRTCRRCERNLQEERDDA